LEMFNFVQLSNSQQWRGPDSNSRKSSWCDLTPAPKFIPTRNPEIPRCWCCQRVYRMRLPALAIPKGGSASIAAPSGILASGGLARGAGVGMGGVPNGFPVGSQCSFAQGGPRIHGGYIVPTAKGTGQTDGRSAARGHVPSNPDAAEFSIHTHMVHHLHRDQVVTRFFNLRKMVGCLVDRLKKMSTS
jgi:hypothetical protein